MSMFISDKELHFIHSLSKELIQKVVNQKIIYYSVSEEHTKTNDLYKESIRKTVFKPVEVNARILFKSPQQTTTSFSIDTIYEIEVYLLQDELFDRQLTPREGDFVKWEKVVYEIKKAIKDQPTFGMIEEKVMIKLECISARNSNIKILDDIPAV